MYLGVLLFIVHVIQLGVLNNTHRVIVSVISYLAIQKLQRHECIQRNLIHPK